MRAATSLLALVPVLPGLTPATPQARPSFLIVLADDCTARDLGPYGGQARTPRLDRLAGEGMTFLRCFQAAPMCSPTRQCLYTGLYPVKSGAYPNPSLAHEWVRSVAHYLQAAGYATHLSGKTHIGPQSVYPFEYSGHRNPDLAAFAAALSRSAETEQPFLFIAASSLPHFPWDQGDPAAYPPASLTLPPVLVDAPETREAFGRYLAEITAFDAQVGALLDLLDQHGRRDDTLVIVLSEQGNSLPFAKWTCYDAGLASACLVRWPGRVAPGTRSEALVEYVDVVPTLLEAAGLERPAILDGRSFLPVLGGAATTHKSHVFALQTSRGILDGPEHYGIRSVRDARYRYVRNLTPEVTFQCAATREGLFRGWERRAAAGDMQARRLVHDYQHRPAEELYDCESDPWNRQNLIADEALAGIRDELRARLDAWMAQQGDLGQATELGALERMPDNKKKAGRSEASGEEGD